MGWMAAADMQRPTYQGYLNNQCVTIAEVLKDAGYSTYMCGKWHLNSDRKNQGDISDNWPPQRGFDRFYGIVGGASNFFNMQYHYGNKTGRTHDIEDFYFTHALSDSAVSFVSRHDKEKPFFLYLSYTAPHWPLHALQPDIDKYVERYKAGWDKLREERFARQKKMGLFGKDVVLSPRDAEVEAWDTLTPEKQHEFVMRMAIYAAQIDAMDQGIGRLVASLQKNGQLDNTLIMVLSDNGACAEFNSSGPRKEVDGKADTFESYRINWANLSSTPYREYKHFTNEGGIATPLIVHYPKGIAKKMNNKWVDEYGHLIDIMATCVDLAKTEYPETYKGNVITPLEGISLVPNFSGAKTNRKPTFWEHEGNIAMRDGYWKLVCKTVENNTFDESTICLFNLENDPTELNDLSEKFPERKQQMYAAWQLWAERIGALPVDTRDYGQRQRDYKRVVNGEFDDNFGGWDIVNNADVEATFVIDESGVISGKKSAKITITKKAERPASAQLKWTMNLNEGERLNISFAAKADRATSMFFRIERVNNAKKKLLDKTIPLTTAVKEVSFSNVSVDEAGNYQLVFYVGTMDGTCWIDQVKVDFD
jgi:arylsulfatase